MPSHSIWQALLNRRMLICVFTGFASGLPLYVLISMLPAWLRSEGVSLTEIGLFTLIGFPYTWKFLWSPLMERFRFPLLGLRRGWMLSTQLGLLLSIAALGMVPTSNLGLIAAIAAIMAFFSASQDIVLDAYRREILPDHELGLGNSFHVNAYRIAGLIPGSLALILADIMPWSTVFPIVALFMLFGIALTLSVDEPSHAAKPPATLEHAVKAPFIEFFNRNGARQACLILAFMFLYKLGDSMATALATPFYLDMGFSLTEIGVIAKHAGLWPMIIGGILGGVLMVRIGINRALWVFGAVQIVSILGFIVLAENGYNLWLLALVIGFEYLGVGLGTAAFVAFIARSTSRAHTATQLALFTALTALPRTVANAFTGFIVDAVGWSQFFIFCTLLAIPGMLLLLKVAPWGEDPAPAIENAPSSNDRRKVEATTKKPPETVTGNTDGIH
ncbi:AmpG family muropeptide MFS transporter [Aestuariirhabdus haliotis]|uniref:AmpG family muropeptide MFS transporter n=1 Tax=Aestuariirhabdus haliotis TaxID=2918751 RepID=UPI0020BE15E6|nr:AmpG family muropeptide MFS transporter [Aestuariirhabdus haliotis]MCL6419991.1 AmpG family muropeptide MFS transporter [Aestuariirhabdus haliotis]